MPPSADWSQRHRRALAGGDAEGAARRRMAPESIPGPALRGTLRPYQQAGVQWLHLLSGLGLGACLADDMGLGKTIQVLSLLLVQRQAQKRRDAGALPAGGAGFAAGQLGGGNRALRPGPRSARSCIPRQ